LFLCIRKSYSLFDLRVENTANMHIYLSVVPSWNTDTET